MSVINSKIDDMKNLNMKKVRNKHGILYYLRKDWQLYFLLLPGIVFYIIFRYLPMYGVTIAFKDYGVFTGIIKSPWVGMKHFKEFFSSDDFIMLFRNTFLLGLYSIMWSFPFPILFAVFLNEIRWVKFKKFVQTSSYLPSFLSVVIVSSLVVDMLSPNTGLVNNIIAGLGFPKQYFMIKREWFRTIYITSGIWQNMGFDAIIYISALTTIAPELYEAARMDGCGRLKSMWYVTLPGILPTVATMFIIRSGQVFKIGFEKVLLLYNPSTYKVADVFSTYVYRKGLLESNYSYATAVGLFEAVVALIIIIASNKFSKKYSEQSLW